MRINASYPLTSYPLTSYSLTLLTLLQYFDNGININVGAFEMAFGALLVSMQAAGTAIQLFSGLENERLI